MNKTTKKEGIIRICILERGYRGEEVRQERVVRVLGLSSCWSRDTFLPT